jgi:hypothetical protein
MPWTATLGAAAAAGALGSLHCAAMCGPLALAASTQGGRTSARATVTYAAGRFAGYAAIGALMGAIGEHALCKLPMTTAQNVAVLIVAGLTALRGLSLLWPRRPAGPEVAVRFSPRKPRRPLVARLFAVLPRQPIFLGLATAILPCGMLLPAWALAAASGSTAVGALTMVVFAAASLPVLLLPVLGRRALARLVERMPAAATGVAWCLLAAWIALRPLLGHAHHH